MSAADTRFIRVPRSCECVLCIMTDKLNVAWMKPAEFRMRNGWGQAEANHMLHGLPNASMTSLKWWAAGSKNDGNGDWYKPGHPF